MKKLYFEVTIDDNTDEAFAAELINGNINSCVYVVSSQQVDEPAKPCGYGDVTPMPVNPVNEDARFKNYLRAIAKTNKIQAIKEAKQHYLIGLKEAKDLVDAL